MRRVGCPSSLKNRFPAARILRIDSETVANPQHPAYGCISNLNEVLASYDIAIASPTIETGVSIDIEGHFSSAWGLFQGNLPENSVRQFLARLRDPVDRHIWVAPTGLNQARIGRGNTSVKALLESEDRLTRAHRHQLQDAGLQFSDETDCNVDGTALATWAKMAARINGGLNLYREAIYSSLKDEGHQLGLATSCLETEDLKAFATVIDAEKDRAYQEHCCEIAAVDISEANLITLEQKRAKTATERRQERNLNLESRYGIEVTPELVARDDEGWYSQLRLHYFLTVGKPYLAERDLKAAKRLTVEGKIWKPDFNRAPLGVQIKALELLNIQALLACDRTFTRNDETLLEIAETAIQNRRAIKLALNITISPKHSPIEIAQILLGKLGLKLTCIGRPRIEGKLTRTYALSGADRSARDEVFQAWCAR
ncbi:MAG: plasmid replication protein, CyRepA1 family, partial [Cyanobacteria bacterium J06635_15]